MAKKKTVEKALNLDSILFNCRDYLRAARNSGSFFEKRDMMLTLVFLRFIGEKYEDGIEKLKQTLIEQGLDPEDENIRAAFFDDATFADGTYNLPPEARWSTIINTPAPGLNVALDTALQRLEEEDPQLKGCFVKGTFTARNLAANDIKKIVDEVNKISHKAFGEEKDLIGRVLMKFLSRTGMNGVNNINRYMQKINPSKPIEWGNWTYKVGDKVLFNESRRFGNVLYNNLKGRILSIDKKTDEIVFQVLVDKVIDKTDAGFAGIKLVECAYDDKSIVEFNVKRRVERDSDADYSEEIVPFQIAYAVSIHKAQGLEYESVKVVITEDVDERISHNIFYTAITRTTDRLKIYMSKETQNKLAEKFVKSNVGLQQAQLFAGHAGLKLKNKLSS